jgi:HAD superfamily hydrolase (TIGR01484 family)
MNTLECRKTHVIACDLDDSLVATQSHSEQVRRTSDEALREIGALVTALHIRDQRMEGRPKVYFGSSTGRAFESIQELAAQRPIFGAISGIMDFHVASVGAALYARNASSFMRVENWPNATSWDRPAIVDRLATYPGLTPQEAAAQDTHKISYTTTSPLENSAHAAELNAYLTTADLEVNVIASGKGQWRFVDVLPVGVDKGSALRQLPWLLNDNHAISNDSICRIAIGDSMNDQAALAAADVAIIPGNGQPDLLQWATENQSAGSFYIADAHFAAGALEGLSHHLWQS